MKKSLLMVLAGGLLAVYACSDKNATTDETTTETTEQTTLPAASATEEVTTATPSETGIFPTDESQPAATNNITTAPVPVPGSAAKATSESGPLNPAHGEPGHRCEIAVGAPLSSAPTVTPGSAPAVLPSAGQAPTTQRIEMPASSTPAPTSIMTTPAPTGGTAPATTTTTAPGMNPPHGEPGHDCAIAVGAPLKK